MTHTTLWLYLVSEFPHVLCGVQSFDFGSLKSDNRRTIVEGLHLTFRTKILIPPMLFFLAVPYKGYAQHDVY